MIDSRVFDELATKTLVKYTYGKTWPVTFEKEISEVKQTSERKRMKLKVTKEHAELIEFLVRAEAAEENNLQNDTEQLERLADDLHRQILSEES